MSPDAGYIAYVGGVHDVYGVYAVLLEINGTVGCIPFLLQKSETLDPDQAIF